MELPVVLARGLEVRRGGSSLRLPRPPRARRPRVPARPRRAPLLPPDPESESLSSLSLSLSLPLSDAFFFLTSSEPFLKVLFFFRFAFGGFLLARAVGSRSVLELSPSSSSSLPFVSLVGFLGLPGFGRTALLGAGTLCIDLAATGITMFDTTVSSGVGALVATVIGSVTQTPPPPEQSPSPMGAVSCLWSHAFFPRCLTGGWAPSLGLGAGVDVGSAARAAGGVAGGAGGAGAAGGLEATGEAAGTDCCGAGDAPAARSGVSTEPSAEGTRTSQAGPGG